MAAVPQEEKARLTPQEEKREIEAIFKSKVEAGRRWCPIDAKWFKMWCQYAGFKAEETDGSARMDDLSISDQERPGMINNSRLQAEKEYELRQQLVEGQDYELVTEEVYDLLASWYQGGPKFARDVILLGLKREPRVDFYPIFMNFTWLDNEGQPDSKTTKLRMLEKTATFRDVVKSYQTQLSEVTGAAVAPAVPAAPAASSNRSEAEDDDDENDVRSAMSAAGRGTSGNADKKNFVRLWIKESMLKPNGDEDEEETKGEATDNDQKPKKVKWSVIKDEDLLDRALENFQFPSGTEIWAEKKNNAGEWVRPTVKQDFRSFEEGDILDATDTVGKWYESRVEKVDHEKHKVFVHFIGWPHKWDMWFEFDSPKLAVQNTHTAGPYIPQLTRTNSYGWGSYHSSQQGTPPEKGVVGLRNLGNTCFMNSTLQCLSNTPILTEYFLDGKHIAELNRNNPLGWKGRVAEEYGALLKEIWNGQYVVVAPSQLKKVLGEFQPRFSGYQQQDSSELLSFLLDALHEDLNRVHKKPTTNTVESNNRPDAVVAQEAWETYRMRNQSVVVDHLQGQLKSRLVCPDEKCGNISITFDPFMFLSVPLPQVADTVQTLNFVPTDSTKPIVNCAVLVAKTAHMIELKQQLAKMMDVPYTSLAVADVWNHRIRFLTDDLLVSDIGSRDDIFVYQVPELADKSQSMRPMQVIHTTPGSYHSREFGLPVVIALPRDGQIKRSEAHARVARAVARLLKPEFAQQLQQQPDSAALYRIFIERNVEIPNDDTVVQLGRERAIYLDWLNDSESCVPKLQVVNHESTERDPRLGQKKQALNLGHCMEAFNRVEVLGENDPWFCSKCKNFQRATKKMDLWRLPDILVVHFKRFSYSRYNRDKILSYVDFPVEGLDMSKFCVNPNEKNTIYDLFAVSNHMGGLGGGHYTAYVKNLINGKWYLLDDSSAHSVDAEGVKSSSAYVLFYHRRGAKKT